ncbi:4-hydroxythreonine-4-phosphate dehydrogenase PdxA [Bifidobacterium sp. B4001]|uniref:4-hydroxythreonine-4-phosphate dehydrogenase PdxA n=1 Tax=Bifidobacterium TaxID=1678 RepID=UPI001C6A2F83|nr:MULTISPECIES: 4-hydroxythreonine-4-phosphate dehydrogenase PdxA [Bifidobacterium]MCX8672534.1 4-hydroxythreonine-4-phosphate dehydrogenase PdxA [Bifidobacterium sp. B4079]MCX8680967.1 4-hydroxythreonine-4-phosphate dehydrogenase PdxA [Bifidobacterium sp. B4001]QYN60197.1 4-hydroxythreonine-4-phosphate dehydrogenase [Bifidobacterium asteroides]
MSANASTKPRIAMTFGDPAGIGPELGVRLLADPKNRKSADIYVLADRVEVESAAEKAGLEVPIAGQPNDDAVAVLDDHSLPETAIPVKQTSKVAGERALHQLSRGLDLARDGKIEAMVFMPLNKTSLHLGGMNELDELRWFAKKLGFNGFTSEINIIPGLWTSRVTSHMGLKDVPGRITKDGVVSAITLLHNLLHDSGIAEPRLGVCALNPHNGENGIFGREEIDIIRPGIEQARQAGVNVDGTYPADTIFIGAKDRYDGVVTMYHDQGQIAIKLMGFDGGVTVQGGLPVFIDTPAHGTAFDLVGQNKANITSSQNAFNIACAIGSSRVNR